MGAILSEIARLWDNNQEWLKERLGQAYEVPFAARWVYMPEVPSPKFNHVSALSLQPGEVRQALVAVRDWFRAQGLPFACVMVTPATMPPDLGDTLRSLGWTRRSSPVMWRSRRTPIPQNPEVTVRLVSGEEEADFFHVLAQVFLEGASPIHMMLGRRNVELMREMGGRNYIAWWRGKPVGIGSLLSRGGMGGIYNMGTLPAYRGIGVARTILACAVADAGEDGDRWLCLSPTPMGRSLYEQAGFADLFQEEYYVWEFGRFGSGE